MATKFRPMSLTFRVVLFVAITVIFCLSLIGVLIDSSINHHFSEQDSGELKVINHSIEHILSQPYDSKEQLITNLSNAVVGHHGVYYQINTKSGSFIYSNSSKKFSQLSKLLPSSIGFNPDNIASQKFNNSMYRILVTDYVDQHGNYKIIVAIDMSFHMQFLTQFRQSLWVIMLGSGLLVLLAAWFAVYQGLNPLRGLSRKMHDIQTNKMDVRLDEKNIPIELVNMVQSFNAMLDRLQKEFYRLSNFSSDIAHELRTPLTNIITQTQVGLSSSRELEEYQELLFSNLEELERLTKMISDMLWLAKTQNGLIKPAQQALCNNNEIDALFEYFDALAEESNIEFIKQGQKLNFYCDKLHFRQLLSNLLSNAIRYTPQGSSITVHSEKVDDGQICISVKNSGEKIPPEHLPYLFDRFYRPDKSRQRHSDGAGLGLAIVKALVEANDGKVEVTSDDESTCFRVFLTYQRLN
ncbi:two-component sensor histidine kinase [Pseudoalteromonas sp. NBT06-2]|uniref:heavy metal sensor histidine kinase n=1 Tax=Pseudoalteromonas sp. NBT06-2 TaxID=2025950 RepID=UPI000BA54526|nr:heavy metal sensor histidine kinase [Pseudoalteromonas sp. NBT06-2]PAJ71884.1 two-component sensor histidine kinase [Pseudoalteromonas sp. NBT06-2]